MMSVSDLQTTVYLGILVLIWLAYIRGWAKKQRENRALQEQARDTGLTEPASLHPIIDLQRCIGCGACASACPEDKVLGLIGTKAALINPSHCIGHGACKRACPVDAITLVFGSEKRGVDIPMVKPNFETNVPGIFIAGELGGMGLIRNAIEQGRQAIEAIRRLSGVGQFNGLDVVIIGAGPAGIAASLACMQHKLRFITLEQDSLGGTVAHYPRGKVVMTAPVQLPMIGKVKMTETTKEALLNLWQRVSLQTGLKINYQERVEGITKNGQGFEVASSKGRYATRAVLLAIGRRGTPRTLGVPGENSSKVVYRLIDPAQYRNQHVLVVGGGDSALEAATSIADEPGTTVTLSYRAEAFSRAKEQNRRRIETAQAAGRLRVLMQSDVSEITETGVVLTQGGNRIELPNNAVIVCAGGILPTPFLKAIGIEVETKFGTA
jgi:thioredoxin reductase (NADPH)